MEEREVGEVHHQTESLGAAHADKGAVFHRVLTKGDFYPVVYITSIHQTGIAAAVAVFIQGHDHGATLGQFDGICCAGLVVVLIAVEQQHTRSGILGGGGIRYIELVGQVACIGFQRSSGNGDRSTGGLNFIGYPHEQEDHCQQTYQQHQSLALFGFHKTTS